MLKLLDKYKFNVEERKLLERLLVQHYLALQSQYSNTKDRETWVQLLREIDTTRQLMRRM